ncbi:MAG: B12-binding domain-containing radical SAM protein [Bacteroidales bacterium]|nr:B12-binding domain-containing radical SAM protein [Bacteroidales bacterium]
MNIGFIFPNKDRRYKTVHLGLAYLAAYARQQHQDLNFKVLDTRVASSKETKQFFTSSFDLIGITVFSPVYYEVIEVFNKVKKTYPKVPVCLGGPYVTTIREGVFKKTPADYAVYGEGEITFSELIYHLKGQKKLSEINGISYKDEHGNLVTNPAREHIGNLNELPIPAYDIFPMERYPLHRMVTSRGCPFGCSWCNSSSIWRKTYRARDPEHIIKEVEYLINHYGKKIFVFGDNSFNIDLKRVESFCELLMQKKIKILWSASIRADIMTQEIAHKMKEAGCYNASIGVESANNEILSKINKSTSIEKITEGIRMLKNAGIEVLSQYVIGSPYETLETVKESIAFAKKSGSDFNNFYTVLPFKGTPQWDYVLEHGTMYTREIHDFHTINPRIVFETPEFPYKDRLEAIKLAKKEGYYSNKDKKSWWFDYAKETSRKIQELLPESLGDRIYRFLKSIYRLKVVKKNNI